MAKNPLTSEDFQQHILPSQSSKRKISEESSLAQPRSLKKPGRKRAKFVHDDDLDFENKVNNALGRLDKHLLADYLIQKTRQFSEDLSLIELEEQRIAVYALRDTSAWKQPRTADYLPTFLESFASDIRHPKQLSVAPSANGMPHTIVVCAAGLRAANVTRSLRVFEDNDSIVAKLFAKHKKLTDAIEYVKKTRMGIGVGTPARLIALMDSGVLSSDKLERIVVDFSNIDQKKRGILDMKETQGPLMQLLSRADFMGRYGQGIGGLDLLFF